MIWKHNIFTCFDKIIIKYNKLKKKKYPKKKLKLLKISFYYEEVGPIYT